MRYKLQCKSCNATCWVRGSHDDTVNATELNETQTREWEGGLAGLIWWSKGPCSKHGRFQLECVSCNQQPTIAHGPCPHDDYTIVDSEYDDEEEPRDPPGFEDGFAKNH